MIISGTVNVELKKADKGNDKRKSKENLSRA